MKKLILSDKAKEQYNYWIETNNKKILKKIADLTEDILKHPFTGIGKPEPLRGGYSGFWSRRINKEHRLVYTVSDSSIAIAQCRYHYAKQTQ
ncbi:MAG: Txe/YoeB family addiction module toxin [Clostridiales Family XIII bacterium]|nr:Txe/YoeB family addiction module toxin [Clostridiales Family XIII bacterium]